MHTGTHTGWKVWVGTRIGSWIGTVLLAGLLGARCAMAAADSGDTAAANGPAKTQTKTPTKADVLILPDLALGGESDDLHFVTALTLSNSDSSPESISIEIFDNDWKPLPVILNGDSEMSGKATWMIPAEDSRALVFMHPSDAPLRGWIRVTSPAKSSIEIVTVVRAYEGDLLVMETGETSSSEDQAPPDLHLIGFGKGFGAAPLGRLRPALPIL